MLAGGATGEEGRALCVFILIGTLLSLLQSIAVRYPRFPVAMGMGMFLAPVLVITLPLVLQSGKPVAWVAVLGLALFPVSWLLHRRWLRTSSQFYRSQAWLTRLTTGNAR